MLDSGCHVSEDVATAICEERPMMVDHGEIVKEEPILMKIESVAPSVSNCDQAIKMIVDGIGNDELITFLRGDISLVERAKDWVRIYKSIDNTCLLHLLTTLYLDRLAMVFLQSPLGTTNLILYGYCYGNLR